MSVIGKQLRAVREAHQLSQEELSLRSGVRKETISNVERGATQDPAMSTVLKLARGLGVGLRELITSEVEASFATAQIASAEESAA